MYAASRNIFCCSSEPFDDFLFKKGGRVKKSGEEYTSLTVQYQSVAPQRLRNKVLKMMTAAKGMKTRMLPYL